MVFTVADYYAGAAVSVELWEQTLGRRRRLGSASMSLGQLTPLQLASFERPDAWLESDNPLLQVASHALCWPRCSARPS